MKKIILFIAFFLLVLTISYSLPARTRRQRNNNNSLWCFQVQLNRVMIRTCETTQQLCEARRNTFNTQNVSSCTLTPTQ